MNCEKCNKELSHKEIKEAEFLKTKCCTPCHAKSIISEVNVDEKGNLSELDGTPILIPGLDPDKISRGIADLDAGRTFSLDEIMDDHFSNMVSKLATSSHSQRHTYRKIVSELIEGSPKTLEYIDIFLRKCVIEYRGMEGLDIAIDVLYKFGKHVFKYIETYLGRIDSTISDRQLDDMWYVCLRTLGTAYDVDRDELMQLLHNCYQIGNVSMRDSVVHALGDIEGNDSRVWLTSIMINDESRMIRKTAKDILDDVFGTS